MTVHKPKLISSSKGLGVNTKKTIKYINDNLAIGTEVWGFLEKPWAEGNTIIAKEGYVWITRWETNKPYVITKFFDNSNNLVGIYIDVTKPVRRIADGFEFDDMYLDVWQTPGTSPTILDEDELSEALTAGFINTKDVTNARIVAKELVRELGQPNNKLSSF
jgi:predicted RNA-binding protein associated with RNAse of E/G family